MLYDVDTYRDQIKAQLDAGFLLLSPGLAKPAVVSRSFPDSSNALEEMESDAKKNTNVGAVIFVTFITQTFKRLTPGASASVCGYRLFIYAGNGRNDELILDYYKAARDILHTNRYELVRGFSNPVRLSRGGLYVSVIDFEVKLPYAGA